MTTSPVRTGLLAVFVGGCSPATEGNVTCRQSSVLGLRACPGAAVIHGVDVSEYDSTVSWPQVREAGVDFAFARISDGTDNPDPYFVLNWQGMKSSRILRGAYQYFRAGAEPTAQADLVLSSLRAGGGLQSEDLPVVMDIETTDGQPEPAIEANMKTWLAAVGNQTGRTPIIYTSAGTYPVTTTVFERYPLWVANYGASCPALPTGWSQWRFWQSSATGSVRGISSGRADLDEFDGTLTELVAFARAATGDGGVDTDKTLDGGETTVPDEAPNLAHATPLAAADGGAAMGQAGSASATFDASLLPCPR